MNRDFGTRPSHRISGEIALEVEIVEAGKPRKVDVLEPLGLGLDEKAIAAINDRRFRPQLETASR